MTSFPRITGSTVSLVGVAVLSLAVGACQKPSTKEKSRAEKAQACKGMVDITRFGTVTPEEILSGSADETSTYKLTSLRVYTETNAEGKLSYLAGTTKVTHAAAEPEKQPEQAPTEKPADQPTEKPAEKPKPVELESKVACFDTVDIQDSDIQVSEEAPVAFSKANGKAPEKLRLKVKAQYKQLGEKSGVAEKSQNSASTEEASADATIFDTPAGENVTRSYYRLSPGTLNTIGVRTQTVEGNSTKISVLVYTLGK